MRLFSFVPSWITNKFSLGNFSWNIFAKRVQDALSRNQLSVKLDLKLIEWREVSIRTVSRSEDGESAEDFIEIATIKGDTLVFNDSRVNKTSVTRNQAIGQIIWFVLREGPHTKIKIPKMISANITPKVTFSEITAVYIVQYLWIDTKDIRFTEEWDFVWIDIWLKK
jgi:S-adenosylmethionine:tRNA-ribosyltransferase-isomerase (queuine synthetase)